MGPFFFNCYFSGAKCPVLNDLKRSFLNTQLIQPLRSQTDLLMMQYLYRWHDYTKEKVYLFWLK